jgi:hypothetical protein
MKRVGNPWVELLRRGVSQPAHIGGAGVDHLLAQIVEVVLVDAKLVAVGVGREDHPLVLDLFERETDVGQAAVDPEDLGVDVELVVFAQGDARFGEVRLDLRLEQLPFGIDLLGFALRALVVVPAPDDEEQNSENSEDDEGPPCNENDLVPGEGVVAVVVHLALLVGGTVRWSPTCLVVTSR